MTLLIKPEPFALDADRLLDRLFDSPSRAQRWAPAMDLVEADDHYVLRADLPGVSEEDVTIEVENDVLTLSGERKPDPGRSGRGYYRLERGWGRFQRQLTMPDGIDPARVSADFDRGVLSVRIPKPERAAPHKVSIGTGAATIEGSTAAEE